jgi:hypothetical protein
MGECCASDQEAARLRAAQDAISREIDRALKQEADKNQGLVKILLLGTLPVRYKCV